MSVHDPWISAETKAWIWIWSFGGVVILCWHLTVATLSARVGLADLEATYGAALTFHPLASLPGAGEDPISTMAAIGLWVVYSLVAIALITGTLIGLVRLKNRRRRGRKDRKGLADKIQRRQFFGEAMIREGARITRPSLTEEQRKELPLEELGLVLSPDEPGGPVALSFEDHLSVLATNGGGKTTMVMAPAALSAPGALVLTSNEVSIVDLIATSRAQRGRVWVFDPLGRAHWPEPMVWDPIGGCEDSEQALARGVAFTAGLGANGADSTNSGFFKTNAQIAMSRLLHAAAVEHRAIDEVLSWALDLENQGRRAVEMVRGSTHPLADKEWMAMLESVSTGADDTVASSRQTLAQAIDPLTLRRITKWVRPHEGAAVFDARKFVTSTDTLVLISDDSSATNVGPLTTMLVQEVFDAAKERGAEHGRLDPPLRMVLDEVANIAPIEKLPELAGEVRKLGVELILAFQSDLQPRMRWGADRGQHLLEQMAAELLLPGVKSAATLERFSKYVGKVDVHHETISFSEGIVTGGSSSEQERDALRPEQIRTLANGEGLLVWRNAPPLVIHPTPWYKRKDADQLAADAEKTKQRRAEIAAAARAGRAALHASHTTGPNTEPASESTGDSTGTLDGGSAA